MVGENAPAKLVRMTQEGSTVANGSSSGNRAEPSADTSVEQNKAVSRRWIDAFNARDDAGEADVRAPDYVAYAPASLERAPLNSETWTRFLAGFVEGFPDLRLTVEDAV